MTKEVTSWLLKKETNRNFSALFLFVLLLVGRNQDKI